MIANLSVGVSSDQTSNLRTLSRSGTVPRPSSLTPKSSATIAVITLVMDGALWFAPKDASLCIGDNGSSCLSKFGLHRLQKILEEVFTRSRSVGGSKKEQRTNTSSTVGSRKPASERADKDMVVLEGKS